MACLDSTDVVRRSKPCGSGQDRLGVPSVPPSLVLVVRSFRSRVTSFKGHVFLSLQATGRSWSESLDAPRPTFVLQLDRFLSPAKSSLVKRGPTYVHSSLPLGVTLPYHVKPEENVRRFAPRRARKDAVPEAVALPKATEGGFRRTWWSIQRTYGLDGARSTSASSPTHRQKARSSHSFVFTLDNLSRRGRRVPDLCFE